ncbi:hypothetical protein ACHAW5_010989, partial [Stephanodiscus triporus]
AAVKKKEAKPSTTQ